MYYALTLRNTSGSTCIEAGYPGVSLLGGTPLQQVGAPAERIADPTPTVTLNPGQNATATIGVVDAGNYPSGCGQATSDMLRIFPPNQTSALTVPFSVATCANASYKTLTVRPLTAG